MMLLCEYSYQNGALFILWTCSLLSMIHATAMSSALRYSPVASEDSEEFSDKSFNVASTRDLPRNGSQCSALRQYVLLLITSLIFFAVGLTIGIQLSENPTSAGTHEAFDFLCMRPSES